MRPGGKSNEESPFFETPNLSFEGRVGILARACAAGPGRGDRRAGGRGSVHVLFRIISGFRFACLITHPLRPRTDGYAYVRTVAPHSTHAG